jgi:Uma2 family endonuclease
MSEALAHRKVVTWEEFLQLDEDDPRELIDGVLLEVEVPNYRHERVVGRLVYRLTGWSDARQAGEVLPSGFKVRIDRSRGVMPDVQFFRRDTPTQPRGEGLFRGHPDLAVEVVSPSSRSYDRALKLSYYAAIGVPEYWLVDPEERTVERLLLEDGAYRLADSLAGDAVFRPATFDGLEIALSEFWEQ